MLELTRPLSLSPAETQSWWGRASLGKQEAISRVHPSLAWERSWAQLEENRGSSKASASWNTASPPKGPDFQLEREQDEEMEGDPDDEPEISQPPGRMPAFSDYSDFEDHF